MNRVAIILMIIIISSCSQQTVIMINNSSEDLSKLDIDVYVNNEKIISDTFNFSYITHSERTFTIDKKKIHDLRLVSRQENIDTLITINQSIDFIGIYFVFQERKQGNEFMFSDTTDKQNSNDSIFQKKSFIVFTE